MVFPVTVSTGWTDSLLTGDCSHGRHVRHSLGPVWRRDRRLPTPPPTGPGGRSGDFVHINGLKRPIQPRGLHSGVQPRGRRHRHILLICAHLLQVGMAHLVRVFHLLRRRLHLHRGRDPARPTRRGPPGGPIRPGLEEYQLP